jgi:hypothetical protein
LARPPPLLRLPKHSETARHTQCRYECPSFAARLFYHISRDISGPSEHSTLAARRAAGYLYRIKVHTRQDLWKRFCSYACVYTWMAARHPGTAVPNPPADDAAATVWHNANPGHNPGAVSQAAGGPGCGC